MLFPEIVSYAAKVALSCGKLREHKILTNSDSSVPKVPSPAYLHFKIKISLLYCNNY